MVWAARSRLTEISSSAAMIYSLPLVPPATAVPIAPPMTAAPFESLPRTFPSSAPPTALPPMIAAFLPALPSASLVNPAAMDAEWPSGATIRVNEIESAPPVSLKP